MKEKYADTIRKKVEAAKNPQPAKKKPLFFLNKWNSLLWPLLISPFITLIYAPINRHVMLPLLGSGRIYEDSQGNLVENYFSANSAARILFYVLLIVPQLLMFRTTRRLSKKARTALLIGAAVMNLITAAVFLEFTLWE